MRTFNFFIVFSDKKIIAVKLREQHKTKKILGGGSGWVATSLKDTYLLLKKREGVKVGEGVTDGS